ncbi:MAG: DUF2267 domain-containing protein [Bacteroidetes bacterium]|nr:DUF2267 domain-containing protein [Bacteroidota bacterium]
MALNFDQFAAEGNEFVARLAKELGYPKDKARAGRVLKSVLHAVRDQLTPTESVQLIAQLPMFLKAVYVHNWSLKTVKKKTRKFDDFLMEICVIDGDVSQSDFPTNNDIETAVSVVFMMLRKYLSLGEIEDIKALLPKELKPLLNTPLML